MGVAALVVMEKRALFRIIFLDQKKKIYSTFVAAYVREKKGTLSCLKLSYMNLESKVSKWVL